MRQSSHVLRALPAFLAALIAVSAWAETLHAQDTYRVIRTENFRREPSGRAALLATVNAGVQLRADSVAQRWVRVTVEGWVWGRSIDSTAREGYDLIVRAQQGENLRAEPNGPIRAKLSSGTLLEEVGRRPGWVRVRRTGWMFSQSLSRVGGPASTATTPATSGQPQPADSGSRYLDRAVTVGPATVYRSPDGDSAGTLVGESAIRVLARSGEWVRVQAEGWVREEDLRPSAPGLLVGVSGAEVRARPAEFEGRLLQWVVQFIAVQDADEVRRDIPEGRRYMLARGPLPETGFVYVVLNEEQIAQMERLEPLAELVVVGRLRAARSHYLGNPVLTLVEAVPRQP